MAVVYLTWPAEPKPRLRIELNHLPRRGEVVIFDYESERRMGVVTAVYHVSGPGLPYPTVVRIDAADKVTDLLGEET